jgi:hypothetical protein
LILLDENIPDSQRLALLGWRPLQIGLDYAEKGIKDHQIVVKLREERNLTFFTEDGDFFRFRGQAKGRGFARDKDRGGYGHPNYAIAVVETPLDQFAWTVKRFLRHPAFRAFARRKGHVFKLTRTMVLCWRVADRSDFEIEW